MKYNEQPVIQLDFSEEMRNSYRDYAVSVIIARALPDVRDGLKPVQRRILYAMDELSLSPDRPHRKSARIVGDTMGKYHPHGDSSIYDALVHMTEEYSLSIPLVDGHGNFGSIDGDGAAAMRYTEARLSYGAMALLENLDKGLVPFGPNFDESEKEPLVLPATIPNLLINGTTGIAVGMATNMPPHNTSEVIDAVIAFMDNPEISTRGLMKYIKGPDFPTGGTIINSDDLYNIYDTGEGRIKIRSRVETEDSSAGRKNLVITQIPYTVAGNKTKLLESLASLAKDKVFDEIYDVRDESSKEGIRIVIEVKKDRDIQNLLNGLYQKTPMEDTYGVNMLAVKNKQPVTFTLKGLINEFVMFQEELYTKEYEHLLEKANDRLEIVEGLIKAADVIDLVIEILRGSSSIKQAKGCLTKGITEGIKFRTKKSEKEAARLDFSEKQADAVLSMQLGKLIGLELLKLHQESNSLITNITNYKKILGDVNELHKVIKKRLKTYKKQFGRERRTALENASNAKYIEEIREENIYVVIDRFGYCKSLDETSYSRLAPETLGEYTHIIPMKNTGKLCIFSAAGSMYQIKALAIPKARSRDKGVLLQTLCKIGKDDIITYIPFDDLSESQLLFVSRAGYVKLVSGIEFETNRSVIASTKLEQEDTLVCVHPVTVEETIENNRNILMITEKGSVLMFPLNQADEFKKTSKGLKGISLPEGDMLAYACVVAPDETDIEFNSHHYNPQKIKPKNRNDKPARPR
ncbi:MAG: DNA topoisomerase 4 subunit A [Lachnospiraceae bacterium]|nr:DNA topoisomerase 4 subunit A [Lachnospiraceae bacterium]